MLGHRLQKGLELHDGVFFQAEEFQGVTQLFQGFARGFGKVFPLHGLARSLIANMVTGVTKGFEKKLEIIGVGFRADVEKNALKLTLGFSHPVIYPIPEGIRLEVEKQTLITVKGTDKQQVGTVAAKLRSIKLPEPYKGKGIRYVGERIRKKVGKTKA